MARVVVNAALVAILCLSGPASADALSELIETTRAMHRDARDAQRAIDTARGGTFPNREAEREAERARIELGSEIALLEARASDQAFEMAWLEDQLSRLDAVDETLMPLMARMIDTLERLVALDLPFDPEARQQRSTALRLGFAGPLLPLDERLRRVLAAYQHELDDGNRVAVSAGWLPVDSGSRLVNFLRVGRLALFYVSPNGETAGWWDAGSARWRALSDAGAARVRAAAADVMAAGNGDPGAVLVTLPLRAPAP